MSPSSINTLFPIYCTTEKSTLLGMANVLFTRLTKIFRPENTFSKIFENSTDETLNKIEYATLSFQSINY